MIHNNTDRARAALEALASVECFLPDAIRWKVNADHRDDSLDTFEQDLTPAQRREVLETAITDALCNLHHLADKGQLDWYLLLAGASGCYDAEQKDGW